MCVCYIIYIYYILNGNLEGLSKTSPGRVSVMEVVRASHWTPAMRSTWVRLGLLGATTGWWLVAFEAENLCE